MALRWEGWSHTHWCRAGPSLSPSLVLVLPSLLASQSPSSWVCLRPGCSYFEGKEHLGLLSSLSSVFVGPVAVAGSQKVPRVEPKASLQQ